MYFFSFQTDEMVADWVWFLERLSMRKMTWLWDGDPFHARSVEFWFAPPFRVGFVVVGVFPNQLQVVVLLVVVLLKCDQRPSDCASGDLLSSVEDLDAQCVFSDRVRN